MKFFRKPFVYSAIFSVLLVGISVYVLLDTFVIPHGISAAVSAQTNTVNATDVTTAAQTTQPLQPNSTNQTAATDAATQQPAETAPAQTAQVSATSYSDENIAIELTTIREYDTEIYIADVRLSSADYLKTALAQDMFGTNITDKTSSIAADKNAIFAVNGDFYGANRRGFVIKNGVIYRDSVRKDYEYDDLVVYNDGSLGIVNEKKATAQELLDSGVTQLFAFGPSLVENSEITVNKNSEVAISMTSNPRTAVGIIDKLHYIFVVSDGRTDESEGLSLYQLAQIMENYGCETAYNLDGGGSATMYFNGSVINNPTTNGSSFKERSVSDIVYIGY